MCLGSDVADTLTDKIHILAARIYDAYGSCQKFLTHNLCTLTLGVIKMLNFLALPMSYAALMLNQP